MTSAPTDAALTPALAIAEEDPRAPEAAAMIAALDADVDARYGDLDDGHKVGPETLVARGAVFLVARRDGRAVACGALASLGDGTAEIKRMWSAPEARRSGAARAILRRLEDAARAQAVAVLRLETGPLQPEAIALYASEGFIEGGPFDGRGPHPHSTYMIKPLAPVDAARNAKETAA